MDYIATKPSPSDADLLRLTQLDSATKGIPSSTLLLAIWVPVQNGSSIALPLPTPLPRNLSIDGSVLICWLRENSHVI